MCYGQLPNSPGLVRLYGLHLTCADREHCKVSEFDGCEQGGLQPFSFSASGETDIRQ